MLRSFGDSAFSGEDQPLRSEPLVVIGLDACDPATVRRMAADGLLPNIARLLAEGARAAIRNSYGLFVGATWVDFATGVTPDRHGFYCWDSIDPASYRYRLNPPEIRHPAFWNRLAGAGRRVCVIDVPHSSHEESPNGVAIAEWGCHDRHHGFHSQPPELALEIAARFGQHPVLGITPYSRRNFAPDDEAHRAGCRRTQAELKALTEGLVSGAARKADLSISLLRERRWDLFLTVFGESHAAGHQLWHLHDPRHHDFDPEAQRAVGGDPIALVYQALDEAVGRILREIDGKATVLLLCSHGMGRHHDGTHLLAEILRRFDRHYRGGARFAALDRFQRASQALLPAADRIAEAIGVPEPIRWTLARKLGARDLGFRMERARQAFFIAPNNHVYGGIRFNLAGREAGGWLTPDEMEGLADRLAEDLPKLVNVETGGRVVRSVTRTARFHRRSAGDAMPDLLIDWERSAPLEAVVSPEIGTVRALYRGWRTGDHRLAGMLVARGPGLPAGRAFPRIVMRDLPATIAARFNVALDGVDGAPIPWLATPLPVRADGPNARTPATS